MKILLYVFIALLVLLILLSTFGGSISSKESFNEGKAGNTEPFLASPPFSGNTITFGPNATTSPSPMALPIPASSPSPLNQSSYTPSPFYAPATSPIRLHESYTDLLNTMNDNIVTGAPGSQVPVTGITEGSLEGSELGATSTNDTVQTIANLGLSSITSDEQKIETFVDPYDANDKHATI